MVCSVVFALALTIIASWTDAACVPDAPKELLIHPQVLSHPSILKALNKVKEALQKSCDESVTRDGLSFAIVGSSLSSPCHHASVQKAICEIMNFTRADLMRL